MHFWIKGKLLCTKLSTSVSIHFIVSNHPLWHDLIFWIADCSRSISYETSAYIIGCCPISPAAFTCCWIWAFWRAAVSSKCWHSRSNLWCCCENHDSIWIVHHINVNEFTLIDSTRPQPVTRRLNLYHDNQNFFSYMMQDIRTSCTGKRRTNIHSRISSFPDPNIFSSHCSWFD